MILATRVASQAHLEVELRQDGPLRFLLVRSRIDLAQAYLLPVPALGVVGLAQHTRLGRLHALHWGLAYGRSAAGAECAVRFEDSARPQWRAATVRQRRLADDCWVADAEGVFDTAVLLAGDDRTCRVRLADRW